MKEHALRAPAPRHARPEHEFAAWNDEMVRRYDIERYYQESHVLVRLIEERRIRELLRLAAPDAHESVLEVGCGAGHVLQRFPDRLRVGVDLSWRMLERARRRLGSTSALFNANAERLPFRDGSFDVVVCTEVLEHTEDPGAVVAELMRVARPAGRVVVSIPNEAALLFGKRMLRRIPFLRGVLEALAEDGNEWHRHRADLGFLRRVAGSVAELETVRAVPFALAPARYVAVLKSRSRGRQPQR